MSSLAIVQLWRLPFPQDCLLLCLQPTLRLRPCPRLTLSPLADWQHIYNRADWHVYKKQSRELAAQYRENGQMYQLALQRLIKDIADSLKPTSSSSVEIRRERLQLTSAA